jgi:hypothetical protein
MLVLGLATAGCCFLAEQVKEQTNSSTSSSGSGEEDGWKRRHTVAVVLVIVAAVVVFSALLLLLLRFLLRRGRGGGGGGAAEGGGRGGEQESALQRQLQQLFHLHDAGLDQDVIDALPVFQCREVAGGKEPFDCAVCLCEFGGEDRLRLLPPCGHAFHIDCIDTWLLSNSTCPLCRCALGEAAGGWKHDEGAVVLPVRLGKFKNLARAAPGGPVGGIVTREAGETSSSRLDARRCYSMGSYQYVLAEASLQVSVQRKIGKQAAVRARGTGANHTNTESAAEGKRIGAGSKGDSFSVSKIWQWPRNGKGKLPMLASSDDSPSVNGRLPWQRRSPGES